MKHADEENQERRSIDDKNFITSVQFESKSQLTLTQGLLHQPIECYFILALGWKNVSASCETSYHIILAILQ